MIKYTFDDGSEYLEHHGILGQKWGKRNGPPYPLSASDHSSSEKKAGWRQSLNSDRSENSDTNKTEHKGFKLSDKQKKALKIGVAVAATALVVYGAYKLNKNTNISDSINAFTKPFLEGFDEGITKSIAKESSLSDRVVANLREAWSHLSADEQRAAKYYTSADGCARIQKVLRYDLFDPDAKLACDTLHNAISKCRLKDEVVSYRYTDFNEIKACIGLKKLAAMTNIKDLVGEEFTQSGFFSTSISEKATSTWGTVKITTINKAGTPALFIGNHSNYPNELELLVNSGSRFVIKDAIKYNDGGIDKLEIIVETIIDNLI